MAILLIALFLRKVSAVMMTVIELILGPINHSGFWRAGEPTRNPQQLMATEAPLR